ncbi:hypothetical protein OKW43_006480 [Paraburkholderia sp. WC7.3g]|uniref:hypothetical protein n=1 Tax=Paraburkholderia sp. WC7.3g TaxID=2991070 RepID=UPI003D1D1DD1
MSIGAVFALGSVELPMVSLRVARDTATKQLAIVFSCETFVEGSSAYGASAFIPTGLLSSPAGSDLAI